MDKVVKAIKPEQAATPAPEAPKPVPAPEFIDALPSDNFKLKYPMRWNGEEYRSVDFGPLRGSDFSKLQRIAVVSGSEDIALVHLITRLPVEVVQNLHADDYMEVLERCTPFIPSHLLDLAESMSEPDSETGPNTQPS